VRAAIPLSLFVCFACSGPLWAGVGATNAGVTTTVGNSTDPSAEVQQQSSGFVQQNQQQNTPTPGGAVTASGATAAQGGQAGANGAQNGDRTNTAGVNGVAVVVPPPAPAVPPPPPPVYESAMRHLDRHVDATPTVVASGPPGAVRKQDPAESTKKPAAPTPKPAPTPAAAPPPTPVTAARVDTAQKPPERVAAPAVVSGGRGEAPDGFTFYSGVSIAGALLAFAFATYLRMGRSET